MLFEFFFFFAFFCLGRDYEILLNISCPSSHRTIFKAQKQITKTICRSFSLWRFVCRKTTKYFSFTHIFLLLYMLLLFILMGSVYHVKNMFRDVNVINQ